MPTRATRPAPGSSAADPYATRAPGKGIQAHRETKGTLHTYVTLTKPLAWMAGIDFADPKAAKSRVAAEFDGWAPELTALITDGETALVPRTLHALPGRASAGGSGCPGSRCSATPRT